MLAPTGVYVTHNEAAEVLGIHSRTLTDLIGLGELLPYWLVSTDRMQPPKRLYQLADVVALKARRRA